MKCLLVASAAVVFTIISTGCLESKPGANREIKEKSTSRPVAHSPNQQWQQPKDPLPKAENNQTKPLANKSSLGPKIPAIGELRKSITQHVCENGGSCFGGNLVTHSTPGAIPFQRTIQPGLTCPNCAGQMYVEIWTVPKN